MAKSDLDPDVSSPLECGICLKKYIDPQTLPCCHLFCLRCLKQTISATEDTDGSFPCPKCGDKFTSLEGDVQKIPKEFLLNSLKDGATFTSKHLKGPEVLTQCESHKNYPDWYCQTCDLLGCGACMFRDHRSHETVEVTNMARQLEPDLLALSKVADKRLTTLQKIASDLESTDTQMETEEAEACSEITKTADAMRAIVTECEKKLLNKVREAREIFKKQAANAEKDCDILKNAASSLNMFVERLKTGKSPLRTVLHVPIAEQEMLQQQDVAVPSVQWKVNRTSVKPWETSTGNVVGGVEMETSVQQEKTFQTENVVLEPPLQITDLQYKGEGIAVGGIAPIYGNMVCVTPLYDKFLSVYTGDGDLRQKVSVPEIGKIWAVVTVDRTQGQLAVVDDTRKVHFVTLSADLEVQQHTTKDVPLVANRISLSGQRQLIVSRVREKKFARLPADGDEALHTVQADGIPDGEIWLESISADKSRLCDLRGESQPSVLH